VRSCSTIMSGANSVGAMPAPLFRPKNPMVLVT
jgi:hypothetical protein